MAATLTVSNPELVGGPVMATTKKLILNGESWKQGEFLNIDASALLKECATDDDAGTGGIKYFALTSQDDPGNSTTLSGDIGVIVADHIFEGNELDGTVADSNIGEQHGIDVSSNVVTIDVGDVTNPAVTVTDIGPRFSPVEYKSDDIKAKLRFQILTTNLEATPA